MTGKLSRYNSKKVSEFSIGAPVDPKSTIKAPCEHLNVLFRFPLFKFSKVASEIVIIAKNKI